MPNVAQRSVILHIFNLLADIVNNNGRGEAWSLSRLHDLYSESPDDFQIVVGDIQAVFKAYQAPDDPPEVPDVYEN